MNPNDLLGVIRDGGIIGVLVVFLVGGMRGWWVFGRHHDESMGQLEKRYEQMREDRDYWRSFARRGLETAKEGVELAEHQIRGNGR